MKYTKGKLLMALACALLAYAEAGVLRAEQESTTPLPANDELATTTAAAATTIEEGTESFAVASLDPAPGTLDVVEVHLDVESTKPVAKSAKLLLLSTPKLTGKRPEEEMAVEEDVGELDSAGNQETTTTPSVDAEVTTVPNEEATTVVNETTKPQGITKLVPVNETFTEEQRTRLNCSTDKSAKIVAVEATAEHNDNAATAVLTEHEADYVLVDADLDVEVEQFGSFTHAGSEVHLQPIVQSVEIVPTSIDDPLIINFVHQL